VVDVLTVGSLFSGIGGIDLGLERAGMNVIWQSEIDPYASQILARHWPDVPNLGDITTIDWSTVEQPDLICGGYPCQPFSLAGSRAGADDHRHLWPYFANAIRQLRPRWALLENVPGHLSVGFGDVLGDLAEIGYSAEWDCIPAGFVGAPHIRSRVFVVAYPDGTARKDVAHAESVAVWTGLRESITPRVWRGRPGDSGRPSNPWPAEPNVGRVAYGIPRRMDRLAALGNAVVPAVAELVGRQILKAAT
jgi:DNA (cytosine-5)-methyltransferase 1